MKKLIIAVGILAPLIVVWIFYGRFAVEGGKAPWAVINDRPEVLKQAIASAGAEEKRDALSQAVSRGHCEDAALLLKAGADPNPRGKPYCMLRMAHGKVEMTRVMLEGGADPKQCSEPDKLMSEFVSQGFDDAPEPDLIHVLKLFLERGMTPGDALKTAEQKKLTQVAAFLKDPASAQVPDPATTPKLAKLGHGGVDRDDLKKVCAGEGVAALPPYQLQPGLVSPVQYFESRIEEWRWPGQLLPRWWSSWDDPSHTQVVVCAKVVDKQVAKECRYEKGGTLIIYDATFVLTAFEGKTARQLGSKSLQLKATSTGCPFLQFGSKHEGSYPDYAKELEAFARPLILSQQ